MRSLVFFLAMVVPLSFAWAQPDTVKSRTQALMDLLAEPLKEEDVGPDPMQKLNIHGIRLLEPKQDVIEQLKRIDPLMTFEEDVRILPGYEDVTYLDTLLFSDLVQMDIYHFLGESIFAKFSALEEGSPLYLISSRVAFGRDPEVWPEPQAVKQKIIDKFGTFSSSEIMPEGEVMIWAFDAEGNAANATSPLWKVCNAVWPVIPRRRLLPPPPVPSRLGDKCGHVLWVRIELGLDGKRVKQVQSMLFDEKRLFFEERYLNGLRKKEHERKNR